MEYNHRRRSQQEICQLYQQDDSYSCFWPEKRQSSVNDLPNHFRVKQIFSSQQEEEEPQLMTTIDLDSNSVHGQEEEMEDTDFDAFCRDNDQVDDARKRTSSLSNCTGPTAEDSLSASSATSIGSLMVDFVESTFPELLLSKESMPIKETATPLSVSFRLGGNRKLAVSDLLKKLSLDKKSLQNKLKSAVESLNNEKLEKTRP